MVLSIWGNIELQEAANTSLIPEAPNAIMLSQELSGC